MNVKWHELRFQRNGILLLFEISDEFLMIPFAAAIQTNFNSFDSINCICNLNVSLLNKQIISIH